jgi:hypothetical protein
MHSTREASQMQLLALATPAAADGGASRAAAAVPDMSLRVRPAGWILETTNSKGVTWDVPNSATLVVR